VCGAGGTILKSTNSGTNWGFQNSTTTNDLNSIFFYLSSTGYAVGNNGTIVKTTNSGGNIFLEANQINSEVPAEFKLYPNYPNPFNPMTKIKFQMPKRSFVNLEVYDVLGKKAAVLVNEELKAGSYEADWNASEYPSGIYFYRLTSDEFISSGKMVLVK
jgi:hypothetical protein